MDSPVYSSLTKFERKILNILRDIGIKDIEAQLLVVFFRELDQTQYTLMRITDLNQLQINDGMSSLIACKWVRVITIMDYENHQVILYSLNKPVEEIIDEIAAGILFGYSPDEMR
ncbi:MAG: hypothetical protein GXY48_05530 [Methanomicrobiales archaeon]|nr:hypothetical protein [Methanomicrobiales archaeon]